VPANTRQSRIALFDRLRMADSSLGGIASDLLD
jgi:hypothetical protein